MISTEFPWLTVITLFPLIAALPIPVLPDKYGKRVRWYTLGVAIAEFALVIYTFWAHYDTATSSMQLVDNYPWMAEMGFNWTLAADGLSMPLVLLSSLVTTLAILASWNVKKRQRLFYFLLLSMYTAQIGVFLAQDFLLFFLMWELELVPVYLLISIWGGKNRRYAATKFILYTAVGSIFILLAAFAMAFYGDTVTFNLQELALKEYSTPFSIAMYVALLIAFGVKLPIFPFHTWLPDAHSEAPAAASMILAGVLLKMAGYGLIRMNMEMLPNAHAYFAPVLAVLGVVSIIYASLTAFAQNNLKRRMAYSSIAHMGFVLIGIASFSTVGVSGAVFQMISHGLIAAVLFFLSGVVYERTHTLAMDEMGGIGSHMSKTFAFFTAAAMASLALPGMSGFVGELTVFLGFAQTDAYTASFRAGIVILAAIGVVLSPIYLLSMLRQVFFGQENPALANVTFSDVKAREVFVAACLLVPIIGIGMYPKLATQTYDVKTTAVVAQVQDSLTVVAANPFHFDLPSFNAPMVIGANVQEAMQVKD
ncbi:MAG: NAD(P)H-quinone oxidoreductase subunit 4 [Leptolyngbyaceae cyanobacterium]